MRALALALASLIASACGADTDTRHQGEVEIWTETYRLASGECIDLVDPLFVMQSIGRPLAHDPAVHETRSGCGAQTLDGIETLCAEEGQTLTLLVWYEVVRPDARAAPREAPE